MLRTLFKPHSMRSLGRAFTGSRAIFAASPDTLPQFTAADLKTMQLPTNRNENLLKIRHSAAHVMAMAVQKLFPKVKVTIGPWIEHG